jgi:ethanolamine utilization protein EutM
MPKALGLVETKGLVAAIEAADAMVKASNVKFVGKDITKPALITVKVVGDTAAVKAAVDAGAAAAGRIGQLVSTHVIPQPDDQLISMLPEIAEKAARVEKAIKKEEKPKIVKSVATKTLAKPKPVGKEKKTEATPIEKKKEIIEIVEEEIEEEYKVPESNESPADTISRLRQEALTDNPEVEKEDLVGSEPAEKEQFDPGSEDIESMNVHKLRHLARSIPDFPIKGREISRANRDELLSHFRNLK